MRNTDLEAVINKAFDEKDTVNAQTRGEIRDAVTESLACLDAGQARVAEPLGNHQWQVNQWLKKAVLLSEAETRKYGMVTRWNKQGQHRIRRHTQGFGNTELLG